MNELETSRLVSATKYLVVILLTCIFVSCIIYFSIPITWRFNHYFTLNMYANPTISHEKVKNGVLVWFAPAPFLSVGPSECSHHVFCTVENIAKVVDVLYFVTNGKCVTTHMKASNVVVVNITYEVFNKVVQPYQVELPPAAFAFTLSNYRKPFVLYVMEMYKLSNVYHFDTDVGVWDLPNETNFLCVWPPHYANDLMVNFDYAVLKDILRLQRLAAADKVLYNDMMISYVYYMSQFTKDQRPCHYSDPRVPHLHHSMAPGQCETVIKKSEADVMYSYLDSFKPQFAMGNICDYRRSAAVFDIVELHNRNFRIDKQGNWLAIPKDLTKANVSRVLGFHLFKKKEHVCGMRLDLTNELHVSI